LRTTTRTTVHCMYGMPHGILHVFNTILYENEFQNPQIFQQTISLFPEHSTLEKILIRKPTRKTPTLAHDRV
jgi:hypothetical protein